MATTTGASQDKKIAEIKAPQDKNPGKISSVRYKIFSFGFFRSWASEILR